MSQPIPLLSTGWRVSSLPSNTPSITAIDPYVMPAGYIRATTVSQMYTLTTDAASIDRTYNVGIMPFPVENTIKIQNNCAQNQLSFSVRFPNYLQITPFGLIIEKGLDFTTQLYTVPVSSINSGLPAKLVTLTIRLAEQYVKDKSQTPIKNILSTLTYKIEPLNVTGPILVVQNPPSV